MPSPWEPEESPEREQQGHYATYVAFWSTPSERQQPLRLSGGIDDGEAPNRVGAHDRFGSLE